MDSTSLNQNSIFNPRASAAILEAHTNLSFFEVKVPSLGEYLDYRQFLKDFYNYKKEASRGQIRPYNYAVFSAAADIKSPNYLKMIIEGKRNLSEDMVAKFAKALQLNKEQMEELRLLVLYTQATEPAVRNQFLRQLSEYRVEMQLRSGQLDKKALDKVPSWIGWILYSMIDQIGVEFNVAELKKLLRGKAADIEIEDALNNLIASGAIVKDEVTGQMRKGEMKEAAAEEIPAALIRKLQAQLMYLGMESLFQDPAADREFGTLTLCLTKGEFEALRFQLRKIRKEINKDQNIKRMNGKGERVYQLNLQLFPVTDQKQGKINELPKLNRAEMTPEQMKTE